MAWWDFLTGSSQKNSKSDTDIAGGTGKRTIDGGAAADIFRWLGAPGRAIAGGVYNIGDKDPQTSFTQGLKDGLTGKSQVNWSDILGEHGVKNPIIKAVGGFAGDVLFDPTTYTGLEFTKGANISEITSNIARQVGEESVRRSPKEFSNAVASRVADIAANDPGHAYAKFMGQQITPKFKLPSKVTQQAKDLLLGPVGDSKPLAKAFSMDRQMGMLGSATQRRIAGANAGEFQQAIDSLDHHFGWLTPEQGKTVTLGLDNGEDLSHVPTDFNGHTPIKGMETLEGVKQVMQNTYHRFGHDEVQVGQLDPNKLLPNYVNRLYLPGKRPEAYPGLSNAALSRAGGSAEALRKELDNLPLQDLLENKGFEPVTHPAELLKARAASHYRKMTRGQMVIDGIDRFGVKADEAGVNAQWLKDNGFIPTKHIASPSARLFDDANMYMPKDAVKTLNSMEQILTDNQVGGAMMRKLDWMNNKFKTLNTVVSPGWWVRNSMSDAVMNIANGVVDPKYYQQAARIIKENAQNHSSEFMNQTLEHGVEQGLMSRVGADALKSQTGKRSLIDLGGQRVGSDTVWERFLKEGAHSGEIVSNVLTKMDPEAAGGFGQAARSSLGKASEVLGDASSKMANAASNKEDFFRLAHFLHAADKNVKSGIPWQDALVKSGDEVRKFNIDYGKMSTFEKNTVRKVVPFYSWMRQNLPLQAQMLFTRPGFMAAYPKGQDLLQGLLGADDGSGDKLVPDWIRNSLPARLAVGNQESKNPITKLIRMAAGAGPKDAVFAPLLSSMTPAGDLENITKPIQKFTAAGGLKHPVHATQQGLSEVFNELVSQSTPAVKAPFELATQRNTFTGSTIKDWGPWVFGQIAPTRGVYNATQYDTPAGASGLVGALTGARLQAVSANRQKAEGNRQEAVIRGRGTTAKQAQWQAYLKQIREMTGQSTPETPKITVSVPKYKRKYSS